jgi:hypothetical protein
VADKYYFFDAWGRMCGHGTAIDPNDPPDPEMELDVYVTYDALGRVIVRTEVENEVPIPLHYYYDLQGNRAWEGPDAETVARVHFHSLYSRRNFALMGSAYYVVDPGDGAAMLCNSDGSFKQVLSTYPTGEPHPITVYGAQEVEALLAGGRLWDLPARAIGGGDGVWYSVVLGDVTSSPLDYEGSEGTIEDYKAITIFPAAPCCCCVEAVDMPHDPPTEEKRENEIFGVIYEGSLQLYWDFTFSYKRNVGATGDCTFTWTETSNLPLNVNPLDGTRDPGYLPGDSKPHDLTEDTKRLIGCDPLKTGSILCPPYDTVRFDDRPEIETKVGEYKPGWVWFHRVSITVSSAKGCPCGHSSIMGTFTHWHEYGRETVVASTTASYE